MKVEIRVQTVIHGDEPQGSKFFETPWLECHPSATMKEACQKVLDVVGAAQAAAERPARGEPVIAVLQEEAQKCQQT